MATWISSLLTTSSWIRTNFQPPTPAYCQWKGVPVLCGPRGLPAGKNILYHNNGDGTFTDVSEKAGILKPGPRYAITAVSYDFDNDGWPDIYVAVDSQPSILFKNNHDGTFTDIAVMSGCAYSENGHEQAGMGVAVADYDCDGWFDIFKTNFADDTCNLYHNNGDGTFSDVTFAAGIGVNNRYVAWGCGFIDYDNDGWPDILQVNGHVYPEIDSYNFGQTFKNPRLVYRNLGNGNFKDVSSEMGPGISERFSSRGAAFGDYNNDGGMDVLILNMNDLPSLLRNDGGNRQNWIKIKLLGTKCNRTAIGARVRVVTGKHRRWMKSTAATSVMSQGDLRLHFGLGKGGDSGSDRSKVANHAEARTLHPGQSQPDPHHPRRRRDRQTEILKANKMQVGPRPCRGWIRAELAWKCFHARGMTDQQPTAAVD